MKILITTLGKGTKDNPQAVHGNYRTATYRFDGCEPEPPTQFFGLALYRHLISTEWAPEKIVILGTPTSMWDAWLDSSDDLMEHSDLAGELYDLQKQGASGVDHDHLLKLSEVLSDHYPVTFDCRLLPFGRTDSEQLSILTVLDEVVGRHDEVVLDVTHGFRHLPMLEMLSSFLLKHAKQPVVKGIYYGALEMTQGGQTPVIQLDGLNRLHDWTEAVAILERTGNVLPLADLPDLPDREEARKELLRYHFLYEVNSLHPLRTTAKFLADWIARQSLEPGPLAMFAATLREAFSWHSLSPGKGEFSLSKMAFKNGYLTKSVLLLYEAVITAHLRDGDRPTDYQAREETAKRLSQSSDRMWWLLKSLRNALAHGTVPNKGWCGKTINSMRADADRFREEMNHLFSWAEKMVK